MEHGCYKKEYYTPLEAKWLQKAFLDLHTESWEREYMPSPSVIVMDGERWKLIVRYDNGQTNIYQGSNSYPENWKALLDLFEIEQEED